jgi:BNR repeat-like domain
VLPYQFYYTETGGHKFDNGSNQTNPTVPPEAVAVAVHPATQLPGKTAAASWIVTHNGAPDYLMTASNAKTNDPDKQWIAIDTNPASRFYGRVYAMWTLFVFNPSVIYESHADAHADGTHGDWSTPQILPTISGKRWDSYMLPHVAPDGTVWTTTTNNPQQQDFSHADIYLIWSKDGGVTWQGPLTVIKNVNVPTYQNTTFREGIVNTFAVSPLNRGSYYPLYVSYEDGSSGLSNIYLIASYDGGSSWSAPILVNDNAIGTEALQPNLDVAPNGTVTLTFYDRRLPCPWQSDADAAGSGVVYDPGTAASPGTPWGRANYCINAAVQFYKPNLTPIGHNVRLTKHTWDPQLSALHQGSIASSRTFIGDYFGINSAGGNTSVTSVTTFNYGG